MKIEIIIIMSWITRSQQYHTLRGIQESDIKQFCIENEKLVSKNFFNFYNLIYLLYNFELLYFNSVITSDKICKLIEEGSYILSKIQAQLLIYIFSQKTLRHIPLSQNELILSEKCSDFILEKIEDIPINSKSRIFYHLSTIQHYFNRPSFKIPQLLNNLQYELQIKYLSLNEQELLHTCMSFLYLPNHFSNALLANIKDLIYQQAQTTTGEQISFNLIVSFITLINKMKRIYFTDSEYVVISKSLVRLSQEYSSKGHYLNCEQLIPLLLQIKDLRSEDINNMLIQQIKSNTKKIQFSLLEYLLLENQDISPYITDKIIQDNLKQGEELRLYILLKVAKLENLQKIVELIEKNFDQIMNSNQKKALENFVNSNLKNNEAYTQLSQRFIEKIQDQAKNMLLHQDSSNVFFSMMAKLLHSQNDRRLWVNWIDTNDKILGKGSTTIYLLQAFSSNQNNNLSHLIVFTHLASKYYVSLQSILIFLKDTRFMIQGIHQYGNIIKRLLTVISNKLKDGSVSSLRLDLVYSIYLIFKSLNFYQTQLGNLLKQAYMFKIYETNKKIGQIEQKQELPQLINETDYICLNYPILLMKLDLYPEDYLIQYYRQYFNKTTDKLDRALILSQLIKYKKNKQIDQFETDLQQIIQSSQYSIQDQKSNPEQIIESLQVFLTFPISVNKLSNNTDKFNFFQIFQKVSSQYAIKLPELMESIHRFLQTHQPNLDKEDYLKIMDAINFDEHTHYPQLYKPLLEQLVHYFNTNLLSFKNIAVVKILKKLSDAKYMNIDFINSVIQYSSAKFYKYTYEERVNLICSFCNLKIIQEDFYNQSFQKIFENPSSYRSYSQKLLQNIFSLGYTSKEIEQGFLAIAKSDSINGIQDIREFYYYCSVYFLNQNVNFADINQIYNIYLNFSKKRQADKNNLKLSPHVYHLMIERMLQKVLGDKYKNDIQNNLIKNQFKHLEKTLSQPRRIRQSLQMIEFVLKELKFNHEINYHLKNANFYCDLYLPDQKTVINFYPNQFFGYDEVTPQGQLLITKNYIQIMEEDIREVKVINISKFKFSDTEIQRQMLSQICKKLVYLFNQLIFLLKYLLVSTEIQLEQYNQIHQKLIEAFRKVEENNENDQVNQSQN